MSDAENIPPADFDKEITIELYKASREAVKHYDELRWKRLSTYLYSTALLFAGVGFTMKYFNNGLLKYAITGIGFLFTACFLVIEFRSADPLIGWVKESHRLEQLLGGHNTHKKSRLTFRQRHAFLAMYGIFAAGWLFAFVMMFFFNYRK